MDVLKTEPPDFHAPAPTPAPIPAKKSSKPKQSLPRVRKELSAVHSAAQVSENELIIKSEHTELENDIASLLETNLHETAQQPDGIDAISSLLSSVNAAIEKISSATGKKKKKKTKEKKQQPEEQEKRVEPLRLRLKTELHCNSSDNTQSGQADEDIAFVPEYEHFVDIDSDDENPPASNSLSLPSVAPISVQIKQERLEAAYGDQVDTLAIPIKQEEVDALETPASAAVKVKQEHLIKTVPIIRIKQERTLKKIKKEKGATTTVAINPLAAAKKKKLLKIPSALALKIKKERKTGKRPAPVRVKQEKSISEEDEAPPSYLGLNPLSIVKSVATASDQPSASALPTVQIPAVNLQLPIITNVHSQTGLDTNIDPTDDLLRAGSVTPDIDDLLDTTASPIRLKSAAKQTLPQKCMTRSSSRDESQTGQGNAALKTFNNHQNGYVESGQGSNLVISSVASVSNIDFNDSENNQTGDFLDELNSILDSNQTDYENAMTAAFEADDLLKQIDEQLKRSSVNGAFKDL